MNLPKLFGMKLCDICFFISHSWSYYISDGKLHFIQIFVMVTSIFITRSIINFVNPLYIYVFMWLFSNIRI